MSPLVQARDARFVCLLVLAVMTTGGLTAPLGIVAPPGAAARAAAISFPRPGAPPSAGDAPDASALTAAVGRVVAYVPLGDAGSRGALAACLMGAAALAIFGALALRRAAALTGESSLARIAVLGAVATVAAAPPVRDVILGLDGGAGGLLFTAVAIWLGDELAERPDDGGAGLVLALLAGLGAAAAGAGFLPGAAAAALAWILGLRARARWALLAPVVAAAAVGLARLVPPRGGSSGSSLDPTALARAALEAGEQLGVVGLLLAAFGLLVLARRTPAAAAAIALPWLAACVTGPAGLPLAVGLSCAPLAVGVVEAARRLGAMRLAAAAALAVMAAAVPTLADPRLDRAREVRATQALLVRGLERLPPRARVDPGSPELRALFRHAAALGLRPDLTVER